VKSCTVAYATESTQSLWRVMLSDHATVQEALETARAQAGAANVPWDAAVGIFGELCDRSTVPRDGDRIEIYRPLRLDPKQSRRARAEARKAGRDPAASRLPARSSNRKT
jgi:putative ubiquitin-RnfH superfamily antitoxin RatB of RatAB toxin-antitoxin module